MSVSTDVLKTVFETSGVNTVLNAMKAHENSVGKLESAYIRLGKAHASGNNIRQAEIGLDRAMRNESVATFEQAAAAAQPFLTVLNSIVSATENAISSVANFGKEVMNMKALTGASGADAATLMSTFAGAGALGAIG